MAFIVALFDLIKASEWPAVAVLFMMMFRGNIASAFPAFLRRVTEIGWGGAKVKLADPIEQTEAPAEDRAEEGVVLPERSNVTPISSAVTVLEIGLRKSADAIADPSRRISILVEELAVARLERGHERVYRNIFGSQMRALAALAVQRTVTEAEARTFFETATAAVREQYRTYGFEGWANFLIKNDLVNRTPDGYAITPFGDDFTVYVTRNQLPTKSPL